MDDIVHAISSQRSYHEAQETEGVQTILIFRPKVWFCISRCKVGTHAPLPILVVQDLHRLSGLDVICCSSRHTAIEATSNQTSDRLVALLHTDLVCSRLPVGWGKDQK